MSLTRLPRPESEPSAHRDGLRQEVGVCQHPVPKTWGRKDAWMAFDHVHQADRAEHCASGQVSSGKQVTLDGEAVRLHSSPGMDG